MTFPLISKLIYIDGTTFFLCLLFSLLYTHGTWRQTDDDAVISYKLSAYTSGFSEQTLRLLDKSADT